MLNKKATLYFEFLKRITCINLFNIIKQTKVTKKTKKK